ncbi:MAG TPA: CheR family methyltransferase [Burkholderiaceae bacterium]|nr:CheR family methyltransferase [Burkholderiaceae bacterium]
MIRGSFDADALVRVRDWAAESLGLRIGESGPVNLPEVLERRIAETGIPWQSYIERLTTHRCTPEELRALTRELTVTETYFFRAPDQLRCLMEVVLPACVAALTVARPLNVLSVGCSSGDEPYSLAIAARESIPGGLRLAIDAIDINPAALQRAQRARYSSWSLRELSPALRSRWFRVEGNDFVLDESIRRSVTFHERNLAREDPGFWQPDRFDIVFCRNVLMYFTEERARAAVRRIAAALAPGGYLFLGHAETLRGLSNEFHLCHYDDCFYYRRKGESMHVVPLFPARTVPSPLPSLHPAEALVADSGWVEAIHRASERIVQLVRTPTGPPRTVTAAPNDVAVTQGALASSGPRSAPDLTRALDRLQHERFAEALVELNALSHEQARDADVLLLRAVTLSHCGALVEAEAACRELLAYDELNAGAHYVLALCRDAAGDTAGAVEHDTLAAHLDATFAMPRLHLGLMERRRGHFDAARRELAQAMVLLQREEASRLLMFGGGFRRETLIALCRAEHAACATAR